ncbi:7-cyano-7-deazaguanine synthase [Symmachiella dynata]|uniref:7-cyano-7-deazaguanine synthase n=2 Tax=Symmachiella dynata TaxID=2527995 RepID=A0A517ZXA0_9PLAN|nr:7-cyano-7-deazaguanine synthase QueC [Symmachiella dynata]QDU47065.1 7-cyano-7-deazaguanine synthase [Symmachiella dynata]
MSTSGKPAVVLVSGGLDSSTVLAIAREAGFELFALTIDYGQRHAQELQAAARVAAAFGASRHLVLPLDLRAIGGSALTSATPVPKHSAVEEIGGGIPVTYVPARNTLFLSLALGWAETLGAFDIFLGVNAVDYSGYPDCRPQFVDAFQHLANLATKAGVEGDGVWRIHTPLIDLTKSEIIRRGRELGVDYGLTISCYDPSDTGLPCGQCDACLLRLKGFHDAGLEDPLTYPAQG